MPTFLDRAIEWWNPGRGLARRQARARIEGFDKARMLYEGATTGRRTHGWRVAATDANAEIAGARVRMRGVSRDMVRNNPIATRAVQIITQNVVGAGIVPAVKSRSEARADRLRDLVKRHLETTAVDRAGHHDIYGIQRLVMRGIVESGECLVRRLWSTDHKLALPFQVQVLEPDYLDSAVDGQLANGNTARQGIEYDKNDRRVAYHLYLKHPGAIDTWTQETIRVPAGDVIHVFRADRAQERGMTWFAPVMVRMKDLADFIDAQLMRQKVSACFAAFVTSETDPDRDGYDPEVDRNTGLPVNAMSPGMFAYLKPGQDVKFGGPPQVGDFDPYVRATLREIAAGLGVTYEALTADFSQVNYSSGRMGWIEFQRSIDDWRWGMLIPKLCNGLAEWTLEAAGIMAPGGVGNEASIGWTPPKREMLKPSEEVPTARDAIRANLKSWSETVRELGMDPQQVAKEIAEDQKMFDFLGIKSDSDGRFPMNRAVDDDPKKSGGPSAPSEGNPDA
jgi:lambda family phage portal protein